MIKFEQIKAGDYDFLFSETFVLANARELSCFIADDTSQKIELTIRLEEANAKSCSIVTDHSNHNHLRLVISSVPGEKIVSKEFVRIGTFDSDSKPLFLSFYTSTLNELSRLLVLNFYTMKHGEDIG